MEIINGSKEDSQISLSILSNKEILKQLLKLLAIIKYILNSDKKHTITLKISNKYKSKMVIYVNDENLPDIPEKNEIVIGE